MYLIIFYFKNVYNLLLFLMKTTIWLQLIVYQWGGKDTERKEAARVATKDNDN